MKIRRIKTGRMEELKNHKRDKGAERSSVLIAYEALEARVAALELQAALKEAEEHVEQDTTTPGA